MARLSEAGTGAGAIQVVSNIGELRVTDDGGGGLGQGLPLMMIFCAGGGGLGVLLCWTTTVLPP